jgi:hypothetical protein
MGRTTDLRRELKRRFYPFAAENGFQIDMTHGPFGVDFRRIRAEGIDVFDLQWEKYGKPRFVVNFGQCSATGVVHFEEHIPPEKVLAYMGSVSGRLGPGKGASTRSWFCQDRSVFRRVLLRQPDRPAAEVVDELLSLFPELEDWFQKGRVGPHMAIINYPWQDRPHALT